MENKLINNILTDFDLTIEEDIKYKLSSLQIIKLIMAIENQFNVEIKEIDMIKHYNVKKILDEFINNKQ